MNKKIVTGILIIIIMAVAGNYAYRYRGSLRIQTAESPEDVVQKFYGYVNERGSSSLAEAYKLISTKHFTLTEDKFKGIVLNYPADIKVRVVGGKIVNDRAVVTIEYRMVSSFGGEFVTTTDLNLDLDGKTKSWKIDFTGESSGEV